MKILLVPFLLFAFISPSKAVTTKMFKVLDTCARYRLKEIDAKAAVEKLKLESNNFSELGLRNIVSKYCSVFTPNQKIEF
ncbi:non-structural protein (NS2)-like protein [Prochlorococcus marinus str. MIT 9515]|uniref:Non-structural protein (NS2)-like protein n=1 Tax=Prochlorococcus marinus (strain MIT 9515) TaxID=167542 RepID=A2BUX9_PROM5|nr:hypothetical protein [Prochlorococcus marinus]ABM71590.1 non-structural protein (NS2)-like protein [Prochlorococcus marinus str. MIT 9515]